LLVDIIIARPYFGRKIDHKAYREYREGSSHEGTETQHGREQKLKGGLWFDGNYNFSVV